MRHQSFAVPLLLAMYFTMVLSGFAFADTGGPSLSTPMLLEQVGVGLGSIYLTQLVKKVAPKLLKGKVGKRLVPFLGCIAGTLIMGQVNGVPIGSSLDLLATGALTGVAAQGTYSTGPVIESALKLLISPLTKLFAPKTQ